MPLCVGTMNFLALKSQNLIIVLVVLVLIGTTIYNCRVYHRYLLFHQILGNLDSDTWYEFQKTSMHKLKAKIIKEDSYYFCILGLIICSYYHLLVNNINEIISKMLLKLFASISTNLIDNSHFSIMSIGP